MASSEYPVAESPATVTAHGGEHPEVSLSPTLIAPPPSPVQSESSPHGGDRPIPVEKPRESPRVRQWLRRASGIVLASFAVVAGWTISEAVSELKTSERQSELFLRIASRATYRTETGPSRSIRFPSEGPYDIRYGYAAIPSFIDRLRERSFRISSQAVLSPEHAALIDRGIFPLYRQKTQAGLTILDRSGRVLVQGKYPEKIYRSLEEVPSLVANTLLFIEDRNLLDEDRPYMNPAVEWDRFTWAAVTLVASKLSSGVDVQGGSTLATQLEKFRHSQEGRTGGARDKLRQMASAALRTYSFGRETLGARRAILLDYINSVPLAAIRGYGEVNGLAQGLEAYFHADFAEVNSLLRASDPELLPKRARAYVQVLSLFLAHRRPSEYLGADPEPLRKQVARYLPILRAEKIISADLYEAARPLEVHYEREYRRPPATAFLERKGVNLVRTHLGRALGVPSFYDLDRLDLNVVSTIDDEAQTKISETLRSLSARDAVKERGLEGFRLLDARGDLSQLTLSFTLYERTPVGNKVRVQTDNLNQPLDVNEGVMLDLGSTAKFRTLVTYLEIFEALHEQYRDATATELGAALKVAPDPLSQWTLNYLSRAKDRSLQPLLEAAMERSYSASPGETFFTGGGVHTFSNFNRTYDGSAVTVTVALRNSINLPFIRIMRDISRYYMFRARGSTARALEQMSDDTRREYLSQFADREGTVFLRRYLRKYQGLPRDRIRKMIFDSVSGSTRRTAALYFILDITPTRSEFDAFLIGAFSEETFEEAKLAMLYEQFTAHIVSLADRAYVARVHPLDAWVAGWLMRNETGTTAAAITDSTEVRQEIYSWLFKTSRRNAQDKRIRMMLEVEAFSEIHKRWQRLGYPRHTLVPSYATAIGSSADRPEALAELMGIILNDGRKAPSLRFETVDMALDTPFETHMRPNEREGDQVLSPELARVVRRALFDVVTHGTAVRIKNGLAAGEMTWQVGGKTGTGDHRIEAVGRGGKRLESRVVSRSATFVFLVGRKFFGVVTAFVKGPEAAKFSFTSALPVQLLKSLEPALAPLLETASEADPELAHIDIGNPPS